MSNKEPNILEWRRYREDGSEVYSEQQWEFLKCDAPESAFVGGLGSGKTHILLRKALDAHMFLRSEKTGLSNGTVIYPTYGLADELFVGPFQELLEQIGIDYHFHSGKYVFTTQYGRIRIFQLQRPHRIVGSAYTWAAFDEFDIESWKNCHTAWMKITGRMRGSEKTQIFIVTSPEGKHYTYHLMVADNEQGDRSLFRAKTTDNKHLPSAYVERMERNYDSKLLQAYRDGEFVNLTQGSIYYAYSEKNVAPLTWQQGAPVVLMWDFNVGEKPMTCIIAQESGDKIHIHASLSQKNSNTYRMLEYLEPELKALNNGQLPLTVDLYGDYAGRTRTTNSDLEDWTIIKKFFAARNVRTRDYVQSTRSVRAGTKSVNFNLESQIIMIHDSKATEAIRKDLELVVWDSEGTREDQSNPERSHQSAALRYYIDAAKPIIQRITRY